MSRKNAFGTCMVQARLSLGFVGRGQQFRIHAHIHITGEVIVRKSQLVVYEDRIISGCDDVILLYIIQLIPSMKELLISKCTLESRGCLSMRNFSGTIGFVLCTFIFG